jgi:hypothetical protein
MPASPSLLIVPARFKTGKLYTQIATTSAGVVLASSGDFNVTRATTATRFNSAGLIESVASGVPRLDYYTSGGMAGCPALLVEPSAANGAPNVQYIRGVDTPAVSGGLTITTGSTDFLAPDGASGSITKYVGGAASGGTQYAYYTGFSPTVSAAGVYTASIFVKAGTTNPLNFCALGFTAYTGASGTATSYFSLASGTALTSGASIQDYGNGWYRIISAPYTIASGDLNGNIVFTFAEGNNDTSWNTSGALNLTAYAWGAQLEAGSVATSYIPTTTAAVTRNADVITLSGAVSGCIGQTEGTLYAEFEYKTNTAERRLIALSDNTTTNRVFVWTLNNIFYVQVQGTNVIVANPITEGYHKLAFAYQQNGVSGTLFASLDGGVVVSGTTAGTFPSSLTAINIGKTEATATSTLFWNARIRSAAIYTSRLTNAELIALSTL